MRRAIVILSLLLCTSAWAQDSLNVRRVGLLEMQLWVSGVAVTENCAYVANGWHGLRIIDIANEAAPVEIGFVTGLWDVDRVRVVNDYVYVTAADTGVYILSISNPVAPVVIGFYDVPIVWEYANDLVIQGNYIYLATSTGLRIIDINDPSAPAEIGHIAIGVGPSLGIAVVNNYAFVAHIPSGVSVIDVTNPASPLEIGSLETPDWGFGVEVVGDYMFVAARDSGLFVVDITNPSTPVAVGTYSLPETIRSLVVANNYAYAADGIGGLRVIDISDPFSLSETGFYDTPGNATSVAVAGSITFVADWTNLGIYDCSAALSVGRSPTLPERMELHPAYPNPFNATTQIRFDVPRSALVNVNVYDITGRLVDNLAARVFAAGTHTLNYDARACTSGMYVVRMTSTPLGPPAKAGGYSAVQKVVLLK